MSPSLDAESRFILRKKVRDGTATQNEMTTLLRNLQSIIHQKPTSVSKSQSAFFTNKLRNIDARLQTISSKLHNITVILSKHTSKKPKKSQKNKLHNTSNKLRQLTEQHQKNTTRTSSKRRQNRSKLEKKIVL